VGDAKYMSRALELARVAEGSVAPRPAVGCVLVSPSGEVVGEGYTHATPGPHAEAAALEAAGSRAEGATAYVSLEPCTQSSVSRPCADQLVDAGVARVVASMKDPNPDVNGRGLKRLRSAGIETASGVGRVAAKPIIEPFAKWIRTNTPFVTLKMAATLDGKIAARDGTSRWITGPEARGEVHELRRRVDAVLVGSMTVVRDDPLLTFRSDGATGTQPLRVVVDGSGRSPASAQIFNGDAPTLVVTSEEIDQSFVDAWSGVGAEVVRVSAGESGVDVRSVLDQLGRLGLCHVLVEGGPTIASSFVEHGLVDRFVLYLAPKLIGGDAPGMLNDGVKTLADAWHLRIDDVRRVGRDIRIDARPEVA
jgi:diaminohydroxyphosphoribosylaminopyrimidine deaminase/5-amino-6-(5-phosphoribosylamino)uracil reductase